MSWAFSQTPLISVLVPIYNMETYLEGCVDSILAQTYPHLELLLVDDGSTDRSAAICERYAQRDARVRVIRQANGGVSAARNTGVAHARGEYLAQVDADDRVAPEFLECLLGLCIRHDVPLAACNHTILREGHKPAVCFPQEEGEVVLTARQACENMLYHGIPDVSPWGKLYHRSLFGTLRYPVGMLYEDTYVIASVVLAAGRMAFTSRPLCDYRIRDDSISRDVFVPSKMDFITAAEHMTACILEAYPELSSGAVRRRVHAALSVRRYFVGCDKALVPKRDALEKTVLENARTVLADRKTPLRDRIAIRALQCGPGAYDLFWRIYSRARGRIN